MKKAVFLDRDGVINKEIGQWVYRQKDFEFNRDIIEALLLLKKKGFVLFIITNQSGIAGKIYNHEDVSILHRFMLSVLEKMAIEIAEIYYCPHHESSGKCLCRKPGSLMIEKALARFNIDAAGSYMIGDKERDVIAAERAGVRGVLIPSNSSILKIARDIN